MSENQRPLSPHLQVYKPQMTSMLSILHRITGAANTIGLLLFSLWLMTLAFDVEAYNSFVSFMARPLGQFLLIGWSFSVFYHLCNGIRHMVWDTGHLLSLKGAYRAAYVVLFVSIGLTIATWGCIYIYHPGVN